MIEKSPSGKIVVNSSGPLNAEIVAIGESPAAEELKEGKPFVGKAGKMLSMGFRYAGLDRSQVYLMNLVPVRAPGDKFAQHSQDDIEWAKLRFQRELRGLTNARVFIALGANPLEWLLGAKPPVAQRGEGKREGFISAWRGSVIPGNIEDGLPECPEDYLQLMPCGEPPKLPKGSVIIPTFHPAAVLRQLTWHPWFIQDLQLAARVAREGISPTHYRKWFFQEPLALAKLAESGIDLISIDTELDPQIVGIATEDQVHVFVWNESFRQPLTKLLANPRIVKIAHNWSHDYADLRVRKGITVARPIYDTQGAAHILNTALQKELSPHISTRFTTWPYHKWLNDIDPLVYCGMDAVVCYDAYWPQIEQLHRRNLYTIADHDHKLLTPLMEMQATGFKIDEVARLEVEQELEQKLAEADVELQALVAPVIERKLDRFEKPHLFQRLVKCPCCGGGKARRLGCYTCSFGAGVEPTKEEAGHRGFKTIKAFKESAKPCENCKATGKIAKNLKFNSDSPDQLADVIYRGLGIKARKYKGNETTKAAQLEPIRDKHPIIEQVVTVSGIRADYDAVARLQSGTDGLLHCVFDPFGTGSGRVASKESLLEPGTNGQNLPKEARRFVVARDGYIFLHPDMEQIEARVVAVLSKDKKLIEAFTTPIDWPGHEKHGLIDSHTRIVQLMLGAGVQITRDQAKRLTYAAIFGAKAPQLTVELNAEAFRKKQGLRLTVEQVQYMIDTFYRVFFGVKQWQLAEVDEVQKNRTLRNPLTEREFTWLGYIIDPKKKELKHEIAKQVWSRLPQDTAAYILAEGLIDIRYSSEEWGKLLTPVQHGHDALLIETPVDRLEEGKALATKLLTRELWGMAFPCKMKTGKNWLEASGG